MSAVVAHTDLVLCRLVWSVDVPPEFPPAGVARDAWTAEKPVRKTGLSINDRGLKPATNCGGKAPTRSDKNDRTCENLQSDFGDLPFDPDEHTGAVPCRSGELITKKASLISPADPPCAASRRRMALPPKDPLSRDPGTPPNISELDRDEGRAQRNIRAHATILLRRQNGRSLGRSIRSVEAKGIHVRRGAVHNTGSRIRGSLDTDHPTSLSSFRRFRLQGLLPDEPKTRTSTSRCIPRRPARVGQAAQTEPRARPKSVSNARAGARRRQDSRDAS
jgi:hypothetical protein